MRLWTIQAEPAFYLLQETRQLIVERSFADPDFWGAYDWMAAMMDERIGSAPGLDVVPIWAWYQFESSQKKKPDLRYSCLLPTGTVGYRIEIDVPEKNYLLSDFQLWHQVLNYGYIAENEEDEIEFDALSDHKNFSWSKLPPTRIDKKMKRSWNRVFDWHSCSHYWGIDDSNRQIQASMWKIELADVRCVDRFIAR